MIPECEEDKSNPISLEYRWTQYKDGVAEKMLQMNAILSLSKMNIMHDITVFSLIKLS